MGRRTRRLPAVRLGADGPERRTDTVAVEEPLEVRLDAEPWLVTMRTPGDDVDLVHGLLHSEGIVAGAGDIVSARYCAGVGPDGLNTYNVLDARLAPDAARPDPAERRQVLTTSACGVCGTTTADQVVRRSRYPLADSSFSAALIASGPQRLREQQRAFAQTGGLHAAGLLAADGQMLCVREDVGRHNAVDKVVGWALRAGRLPLSEVALIVSGRASYELTQKAVLAGIPLLAAVSAPSSLAIELAVRSGLTLVGFVRGDTMNLYSGAERVLGATGAATIAGGGVRT